MKKIGVITMVIVLCSWQMYAQDIKNEGNPDEQIIVNKKYDENGNLIQFDSTYVHTWSSDSTFRFSLPDDGFFARNGFPDIDGFFRQFQGLSPDSIMMGIPFDRDSMMRHFNFNGPGNVPPGFDFPDIDELGRQLEEQLKRYPLHGDEIPQFKNKEQQKEWEGLMEKHRKEMDELRKKWEGN